MRSSLLSHATDIVTVLSLDPREEQPMEETVIPANFAPGAPAFAGELDEAIVAAAIGGAELPEPVRAWAIESPAQAEWAMRKLRVLDTRHREVTEQAAAWREPIDDWERAELERILPSVRYFAGRLEQWGVEQRLADPREATLRLPSGEVATTQQSKPTVSIVDEAVLLDWCADNLDAETYELVVKTELSVRISELRKIIAVDATDVTEPGTEPRTEYTVVIPGEGVVVPGLEVTPPSTSARVKPA